MGIHVPPTSPPKPARRTKKVRLDHLNMGIAKTHRIATQLVGIQLSGANLLALMVSAASVVAGTVSLVAERSPFNWPLLLSAGVIGLGLALLIEGLTLGSLIRIRLANRAIRQIEEQLEDDLREALAALAVPDLAQPNGKQAIGHYRQMRRLLQQEYRHKRQQATRLQRRQRRFSLPLASMGAMCSAIAGGLFYHTILAGLGPVESLVLALLFPLVVTGTFVSSEIHKDAQEDAIREGFGGGALTETAIREETKLTSALAVHQHVLAYLEKPEAERAIEEGARHLLADILAELRASSQQATRRVLISEEQGDDTTRQLAFIQERGDTTSSGMSTTDDTTAPVSGKADDRLRQHAAPSENIDMELPGHKTESDMTRHLPQKEGDTTAGAKATNDLTRHALPPHEERDTSSPSTIWADNARECGSEKTGDLTRQQTFAQERDDTICLPHDATGEEKATSDKTPSGTARTSDTTDDTTAGAKATSDLTHSPPLKQEERDTTSSHPKATGDPTNKWELQSFSEHPLSDQGEKAREQDPVTTQILTYLAQRPHAKQADVAAAQGIAVRTVQRKLTAWKQQQGH